MANIEKLNCLVLCQAFTTLTTRRDCMIEECEKDALPKTDRTVAHGDQSFDHECMSTAMPVSSAVVLTDDMLGDIGGNETCHQQQPRRAAHAHAHARVRTHIHPPYVCIMCYKAILVALEYSRSMSNRSKHASKQTNNHNNNNNNNNNNKNQHNM
eukprot:546905-Amphidinium_carterae.1